MINLMKQAEKMNLKETDLFHAHAFRDGIYEHPQDFKKAKEQYPTFTLWSTCSLIMKLFKSK